MKIYRNYQDLDLRISFYSLNNKKSRIYRDLSKLSRHWSTFMRYACSNSYDHLIAILLALCVSRSIRETK